MKKLLLFFSIALIPFLFSGCCAKMCGNNTSKMEKEGYVKATITNLSGKLDACSWLIKLEDGTKLEPYSIPAEYKTNNLKVWVKYEDDPGRMSICMAGKIIKLVDIKERK
ncbi:MAG: hypothetical protein WCK02_06775 [Bacteroidota bacterium]